MSPTKEKTSSSGDSENAFQDVSKQQETVQEELEKPVELDDDGKPVVDEKVSQAAEELGDEQGRRASASFNGGGPWPPELIQERFVGASKQKRVIEEYTSHEES